MKAKNAAQLRLSFVQTGSGMRFSVQINNTSGPGGKNQTMRIGAPTSEDAKLDLSTMPSFRPQVEPLAAAMGRAAPDLVILGLWSGAMMLLAFWKFLKYDVR